MLSIQKKKNILLQNRITTNISEGEVGACGTPLTKCPNFVCTCSLRDFQCVFFTDTYIDNSKEKTQFFSCATFLLRFIDPTALGSSFQFWIV